MRPGGRILPGYNALSSEYTEFGGSPGRCSLLRGALFGSGAVRLPKDGAEERDRFIRSSKITCLIPRLLEQDDGENRVIHGDNTAKRRAIEPSTGLVPTNESRGRSIRQRL